jgi:hypothetical protein
MYRLENPDDGPVTLRLSLRADRHGRAVFEKTVTLGPRSELNGRELVVAAASDSYTLSLFRGTDRIERTSIPTRHTDPVEHNQIVFLNDDPEFSGSGTLSKTNLLNDRVRVSSVGARQAPHHWAGYSDARAVAICRPEFSDMTAMQFAALDEYVHRGGTLLFLEPDGTLGAAGTPLCDLLPVRPLRTRRVEVLPEVDGWGEQFRSHQDAAGLAARLPLASADSGGGWCDDAGSRRFSCDSVVASRSGSCGCSGCQSAVSADGDEFLYVSVMEPHSGVVACSVCL